MLSRLYLRGRGAQAAWKRAGAERSGMAALNSLRDCGFLKLLLQRIRPDMMVFLASKMTKQDLCKSMETLLMAPQRPSQGVLSTHHKH